MVKQWLFRLQRYSRSLSFRAACFCVLALGTSLVGVVFEGYVPDGFADLAGGKAVDGILTIMSSSMLIVATFALSNMVTAYSSATQHATPRATRLIKEDTRTHSAISIFLGAFIYSIVSLIALSTGYYGKRGRVILLLITILVLSTVVAVIIRWVDQLMNMGSVSETISRVERVTLQALRERIEKPTFGCRSYTDLPGGFVPVKATGIGFIQNIDITYLGKLMDDWGRELYIARDIGEFLNRGSVMAQVQGAQLSEEQEARIRKAFAVGEYRTFTSDPVYGASVLSGIGIKAMSPGINDPGTAIDVVGALSRILAVWDEETGAAGDPRLDYPKIYFPVLKKEQFFQEAFTYLVDHSLSSVQVTEAIRRALVATGEMPLFKTVAVGQLKLLESKVCSPR